MISAAEAAVQLRVKPRWIRRMCATKQLKAIKKSGVWDIDPDSLEALAKQDRRPGRRRK